MEKNNKEFTFLNYTMISISLIYGIFLVVWGVGITFFSGSNSITSLIPSFLGIPIIIMALLSIMVPSKQKLFMHIVVIFGLLIFIGGADLLRNVISGSNPFNNIWAGSSKLMLFISGFLFSFLCIQSFRFARKNKIEE